MPRLYRAGGFRPLLDYIFSGLSRPVRRTLGKPRTDVADFGSNRRKADFRSFADTPLIVRIGNLW